MVTNIRLSGAQTSRRSESDVRFNYNNLQQVIGASNSIGGASQAQFYSSTGGTTWSQTSLPTVTGDTFQSDPCIDWTSDGTAWALTVGVGITGFVVRSFKSINSGQTWTFDATISGTQSNVDKPNLWVDHSPSSPYKDNMYALWWNNSGGGPTWVARRAGPTGTWQAPQQISGTETTGGSDGGDIKTNTFGDVFAFWPSEAQRTLLVAKSTDGGVKFGSAIQIATTSGSFKNWPPAQDLRGALLYISAAAYRTATQDNVYACWADLAGGSGCNSQTDEPGSNVNSSCTVRIWFSRSTDGGAHWETPKKINDQASKNDQFFPRLALDETSGDMVVVYYDTVNDPSRVKTDIWMQSSTDDGITWTSAVQITSTETNETSAGADTGNQYGDYIGLTGYAGQFFACWTDRRSGSLEEIWGAPITLVQRACTFEIDRDHYGQDEIDGLRSQPGGAVVKTGFHVQVDGFTARELGITGPGSTNLGPPITFSPSTGVFATCTSLVSTDPAFPPDELQRFRFGYDVNFGNDDSAFTSFAGLTETVTLTTSFQGLPAVGQVTFMKQPDPYILQGAQTWWLSSDIRLIQVVEGDAPFGVNFPVGGDPFQFLTNLTTALEAGQGIAGGQSFNTNTAEDNEVISVAPQTMRNGQLVNVYNFAIARVHYQGLAQPAAHVRVFFRLFAANSTATDFHEDTTYSRVPATYPVSPPQYGQHETPTMGVIGGEYVSIPCFGAARQNPTQSGAANTLPTLQLDTFNDRTLSATGGPLHDTFYGCFLDINQTQTTNNLSSMPVTPPPGNEEGPWPPSTGVALQPLQQSFIKNEHQCLVAEISFDPDPITPGTQPWNSDKLAQRNISWSYTANPGLKVSRQALETFEVRPTPVTVGPNEAPDEIMIDWLNVPAGELAEIYLPAVSADAILAKASELYPTHRLSRIDANTIGCSTGGVSYIPLPAGSGDGANFAGLMSVSLPAGIRKGQLYSVVVRQLTNAQAPAPAPPPQLTIAPLAAQIYTWRRVLGTFQINIPVSTKELLLEKAELRLSIFRWIVEGIPVQSRWYPVMQRYLQLIAIQVSEMGGDPTKIKPSPNGYGGLPSHHKKEEHVSVTGKIEAIMYDHFGDFDGFILETNDGEERHFRSHEPEVESLVRGAWEDRIVTTVIVDRDHQHRPLSIILRRSSAL